MRFYLLLACFLIICVSQSCRKPSNFSDPWTKVNSPFIGEQLRKVQFISNEVGYILGLNVGYNLSDRYNAILKTTDGGKTWQQHKFSFLEDGGEGLMFVYDSSLIFSAGNMIFKSLDGGYSWAGLDPSLNAMGNRISGMCFFDEKNGIVAKGGQIFRTNDGGSNFKVVLLDSLGLAFADMQTLPTSVFVNASFAQGNIGMYYKSSDRGISWHSVSISNGSMSIYFVNESTGYGLLGQTVYKTEDGGQHWMKQSDQPLGTGNFSKLYFITESNGYVITPVGEIFHTTDSGRNWNLEHKEENFQLNDITSNGSQIFVVGQGNLILTRELK